LPEEARLDGSRALGSAAPRPLGAALGSQPNYIGRRRTNEKSGKRDEWGRKAGDEAYRPRRIGLALPATREEAGSAAAPLPDAEIAGAQPSCGLALYLDSGWRRCPSVVPPSGCSAATLSEIANVPTTFGVESTFYLNRKIPSAGIFARFFIRDAEGLGPRE
jgi:hypothetical protein